LTGKTVTTPCGKQGLTQTKVHDVWEGDRSPIKKRGHKASLISKQPSVKRTNIDPQ